MTASVQERRQALEAAHSVWRPMTPSQALDPAAARYADRPLVLTDECTYTYADSPNETDLAADLKACREVELVAVSDPQTDGPR